MYTKNKISLLRETINNLDYEIIKLLKKREYASIEILKYKISNQLKIRDKNREIEIFQNLNEYSKKKKIDPLFIKKLFQEIIKNSILIQKSLKKKILLKNKKDYCGYLGPIGSYSYTAFSVLSEKHNDCLLADEYSNFESIMHALNQNKCTLALFPIENKISGIIPEVYDILKKQKEIYIIEEIYINIPHQLLTIKNCPINNIQDIYSHTQPFKQCSIFLKKFPEWKKHYFNSTSSAIHQMIKENNKTTAVLGNPASKNFYNLKTIASNISNHKNNITRFVVVSQKPKKVKNSILSKITMLITLNKDIENKNKISNILKNKNIKIIKWVKPVHINEKKQITYFIEIQSNIDSEVTKNTLRDIKKYTIDIHILGCYPIALA